MSSKKAAPDVPAGSPTRKRWITVAKVAGAVISVISFVTGIIAVIPILTRDASNFSSLTIDVTPFPATSTEWALPLDTDFASFPVGTQDVCTADQQAWLADRGQQVTTRFLIDFRNSAADGPMLTVKDFRVVGTREADVPEAILAVCDTAPVSGVRLRAARIDASSDGNVAVYGADAFGLGDEGLPDIPVAWNLAPGEGGQLIINVTSSTAFDGVLDATVLSGTESRTQELGKDTVGTLSAPPLFSLGTIYLQAAGALQCRELNGSEALPCDLTEVLARGDAETGTGGP